MMKPASMMVIAAACAALFAAPAFAQAPAGGGDMGKMGNMKMSSAPKKHMKMARHSHHKMGCYDLAWMTQEMKDCLEKSGNKPM